MGQVLIGAIELTGFIAGIHLEPFNLAAVAVGLGHRCIKYPLGGRPNINAGAIAADVRNDWVGWHLWLTIHKFDCLAAAGGGELFVGSHRVIAAGAGQDEPSFACSAVINAAELALSLVILRNFCSHN